MESLEAHYEVLRVITSPTASHYEVLQDTARGFGRH